MPVARKIQIGPLYARLKRHLLEHILDGNWKAGDRVPSENELVKSFEVSRMTANRSLKELTNEGYLVRVPGVGTFVADFKAKSPLLEIRNIADEIRERGHAYHAEIILNVREKASPELMHSLELEEGAEVFHTIIVHREQGLPIQVEERFVSPAVVPGYGDVDFTQTTPSAFLIEAAPLQEAEHIVRACIPDSRICELLHMDPSDACLTVERRTWSNGRPATQATLYHPGKRFELSGRFKP